MQFTENSYIALRTATYRLRSPRCPVEFALLPMIHIGTPQYYLAVREALGDCDTIIYEGVKSFRSQLITASYRYLTKRKRLGLVTQKSALRLTETGARLIHGDVTTVEFERGWSGIPWYLRLAILVGAPVYGAYLYLTATRKSIARREGIEDLPSQSDILRDDDFPGFNEAIHFARDAKLVAVIESLISSPNSAKIVAVVYGAAHMGSVTALLMGKYAYRVVSSAWLTAIDYRD